MMLKHDWSCQRYHFPHDNYYCTCGADDPDATAGVVAVAVCVVVCAIAAGWPWVSAFWYGAVVAR